jgi:hypothetical protein
MNEYQSALACMALGLIALLALPTVWAVFRAIIRSIRLPSLAWLRRRPDPFEIRIGKIELGGQDRLRHTHIVGATGSGKSVLLENLILADIKNGLGALIIDPKGDRSFYERIKKECKAMGREEDLHLISANYPEESRAWNPCRLGDVAEVHSKLINPWVFSEPFYEKSCHRALLHALNALDASKAPYFLPDVQKKIKNAPVSKDHIQGLDHDLGNLIESEWKELLMAGPNKLGLKELSILDAVRKNEIIFLDLPAEGKSTQSKLVGKLFLQELMLISGLRKVYPGLRTGKPFMIYVDEFDAFANESFITFLNKGRSSDLAIHLAHQTLSDLKKVSPEFQRQVLGNTNVRFVFRQDDPDDAETWALFFGTKEVVKSTYRVSAGSETGDSSNRLSREFNIHPDAIKALGTGECVYSAKSRRALEVIKVPLPRAIAGAMKMPISRASGYYQEPRMGRDDEVRNAHRGS